MFRSLVVGTMALAALTVAPAHAEAVNCVAWWFPASGGAQSGATSYCSDHAHKVRVWCSNGGSYVGNYAYPQRYSFASCPGGSAARSAITILV